VLTRIIQDKWFAAGPLPTDPNRAFAMSGTSRGLIDNFNGHPWKQESYMNLLTRKNISWAAFYDTDVWALGNAMVETPFCFDTRFILILEQVTLPI
jgi:phospholipase C